MRVISMTPEQIAQLPPNERSTMIQLVCVNIFTLCVVAHPPNRDKRWVFPLEAPPPASRGLADAQSLFSVNHCILHIVSLRSHQIYSLSDITLRDSQGQNYRGVSMSVVVVYVTAQRHVGKCRVL